LSKADKDLYATKQTKRLSEWGLIGSELTG
jgi:hypothetical protein